MVIDPLDVRTMTLPVATMFTVTVELFGVNEELLYVATVFVDNPVYVSRHVADTVKDDVDLRTYVIVKPVTSVATRVFLILTLLVNTSPVIVTRQNKLERSKTCDEDPTVNSWDCVLPYAVMLSV